MAHGASFAAVLPLGSVGTCVCCCKMQADACRLGIPAGSWKASPLLCCARYTATMPMVSVQIDSHMRFAQGWDAVLLRVLRQAEAAAGHPRVVLSTYPPGYEVCCRPSPTARAQGRLVTLHSVLAG